MYNLYTIIYGRSKGAQATINLDLPSFLMFLLKRIHLSHCLPIVTRTAGSILLLGKYIMMETVSYDFGFSQAPL